MRYVLAFAPSGRLRHFHRDVVVGGVAENLPIVVARLHVLAVDRLDVVADVHVDPILVGRTVAVHVGHAILAVLRLHLEAEVARRVDARHRGAGWAGHACVRRAQLADHRVRDVVDVLVRSGVLEQRLVFRVERRPVLAVHVRVVVAVLHDPVRFVEDLFPLVAPVDANVEREIHRLAGTSACCRRASHRRPLFRRRPHRRPQSSVARSEIRLRRRRRRVLAADRLAAGGSHRAAEVDRAAVGRRLHAGERAGGDAPSDRGRRFRSSTTRSARCLHPVRRVHAPRPPPPAAADRVVDRASVARQEVAADAGRSSRQLPCAAIDATEVDANR